MPVRTDSSNTSTTHSDSGPLDCGREAEIAYERLMPLMKKFGANCTPKEFYWAVNRAFHAVEAAYYDQIHADMFAELTPVWRHFIDLLPETPKKLSFLDIGCGTGLVGEMLARFCPDRVEQLYLLDPSAEMLEQVRTKSEDWPFPCQFHQGDIRLEGLPQVDVVTVNSVLHHVVELQTFLEKIQALIKQGGMLLTANDPRAGAEADELLRQRRAMVAVHAPPQRLKRVYHRWRARTGSLVKRVLGIRRAESIPAETNRRLLAEGVIQEPMDIASIWAVTDFHVPDQPGGFGHGIDLDDLRCWLGSIRATQVRTHQFHDARRSSLTDDQRARELAWLEEGDVHGRQLATAWVKSPRHRNRKK